jgi:hypothetical protein
MDVVKVPQCTMNFDYVLKASVRFYARFVGSAPRWQDRPRRFPQFFTKLFHIKAMLAKTFSSKAAFLSQQSKQQMFSPYVIVS